MCVISCCFTSKVKKSSFGNTSHHHPPHRLSEKKGRNRDQVTPFALFNSISRKSSFPFRVYLTSSSGGTLYYDDVYYVVCFFPTVKIYIVHRRNALNLLRQDVLTKIHTSVSHIESNHLSFCFHNFQKIILGLFYFLFFRDFKKI